MIWRGQAVAYGEPQSMGSKRILTPKKGKMAGRPFLVDDNRPALRSWQAQLRESMQACAPPQPLLGAVAVEMVVFTLRPKAHYGTGKNEHRLKGDAPALPATGRDLDKVLRAALDVGSGIWWKDDKQVCMVTLARRYCNTQPRTVLVAWVPIGAVALAAELTLAGLERDEQPALGMGG